jgi:chromosome segregation ATPase
MSPSRIAVVLALIFGVTTAVALRAQAPPSASPSNDAVAALVIEVRALRTELSQAANASLRSQMLVTRVQLQEQRLMHLDRQRAEVVTKLGDAEKMRALFSGQLKTFESPDSQVPPEERRHMEDALAGLKAQLQAVQSSEATLRNEQDTLLSAISTEQSRWSDFNSRLDELERSLPARR